MAKWLIKLGRWLRARSPWRREPWSGYHETIGEAIYNPKALKVIEEAWLMELRGALEVLEEEPVQTPK